DGLLRRPGRRPRRRRVRTPADPDPGRRGDPTVGVLRPAAGAPAMAALRVLQARRDPGARRRAPPRLAPSVSLTTGAPMRPLLAGVPVPLLASCPPTPTPAPPAKPAATASAAERDAALAKVKALTEQAAHDPLLAPWTGPYT